MEDAVARLRRAAREVRAELVPDPRVDVFEVRTRRDGDGVHADVATTVPAAADRLRQRLRAHGVEADVRVRALPDAALAPRGDALVRAPIAPVYRRPTMNSTQLTQQVLGSRVTLLSRRGRFWRIRGQDRHVGWVHQGYLVRTATERALAWETGVGGEPVVSLGAVLLDRHGVAFARLPWGARLLRLGPDRIRLPDGRDGRVGEGELVAARALPELFPPVGERVTRTARRWLGAPYLWGGVTPHGVDCSGFVQSIFRLHGLALPRDSDMQAGVGDGVVPGDDWRALRPGDLVFFAERRRVNHVALSLGAGRIIHASASNGGVDVNDLNGDGDVEHFLRGAYHSARRLLSG